MNIAMLGKKVSEYIEGTSSLLVEVLSARFGRGYEGIKRSKIQSSSVWTTMRRLFFIIESGFTYMMGNGETNFWEAIYLQGKPIKCLVDYVHISDSDEFCHQMIVNGRFDIQSLHTTFPAHITKALKDIRNLYLHPSVPDMWCWSDGSKGTYSVASCYEWLLKHGANPNTSSWKRIWKPDVWARLVHCGFPYRLAHTIPCDIQVLEFIVHAPTVMRFAFWFIWLEWNNRVFGNSPNALFVVVKEILSFFQWWKTTWTRADRLMDGPSGFGAVLRNHEGVWIEGNSGNIGITDNTLAKVIAILEGLSLAMARQCTALTCYSESQEALRLVNTTSVTNHVMGGLIMNIRDKISSIENIRFFHLWRERNSVADLLARRGAKEEAFFTTWAFPPDDLLTPLAKDAPMFPYTRL
ncbi:ribonuclease H [Striga asiatica]|uniref:Ribonuclease H n=1 Tax=Striga asiatica TaxID=4170 RepID=A0A5A7NZ04_STRAF|nr:ribonuclease H [Striga asiatica]